MFSELVNSENLWELLKRWHPSTLTSAFKSAPHFHFQTPLGSKDGAKA